MFTSWSTCRSMSFGDWRRLAPCPPDESFDELCSIEAVSSGPYIDPREDLSASEMLYRG